MESITQIILSDVGVRFILAANRQLLHLETGMETRAVHDNRDTVDSGGKAVGVWPCWFFVTHSRDVMCRACLLSEG